MKSINIIACGSTASQWPGTGESLGVNDCEKIGKSVDKLLVINWPNQFASERLKVIQDSKAKFYSQLLAWQKYKPDLNLIVMNRWRGSLRSDGGLKKVNFSSTSPFVAITLAWTWGYKEMILWGVDLQTHKSYGVENPNFLPERALYSELVNCLAKDGVKVWLGCEGSALNIDVKPGGAATLETIKPLING